MDWVEGEEEEEEEASVAVVECGEERGGVMGEEGGRPRVAARGYFNFWF